MKNRTRITLMALALSFVSFSAHAFVPAIDPLEANDDPTYLAGKKALDEQRWRDAVREFDKILSANSGRADGAYYWKAYALNKMHHGSEAMAECDVLHAKFPKSDWNNDCKALSFESGSSTRVMVFNAGNGEVVNRALGVGNVYTTSFTRTSPEDDMKILALNSLLRDNPDKALPQLRSLLAGNSSLALKKHTILVLAQSKNPEAGRILDDAMRGKMDPQLQREAIIMSGVFHRASSPAFVDIYKTSADANVKKAVIDSLFISHDADKLVDIARSEKDLEMKRRIVSQLALMHDKVAQDYMLELLK